MKRLRDLIILISSKTILIKLFDTQLMDVNMAKKELMNSVYYQNTFDNLFGNKLGLLIRRRIFEFFMDVMNPTDSSSILDVGVTSDNTKVVSNFFEGLYPYPGNITCVGTEDGSHLESKYEGLHFHRIQPGQALPFRENEFDIAFSNAVVEHTGDRKQQEFFIREICRVAKNIFIATPNRWFPIESHSGLPFIQYLPQKTFRNLLKGTRFEFWSSEQNLNLLSMREFEDLFPLNMRIQEKRIKIFGITSNLIVYGSKG